MWHAIMFVGLAVVAICVTERVNAASAFTGMFADNAAFWNWGDEQGGEAGIVGAPNASWEDLDGGAVTVSFTEELQASTIWSQYLSVLT